MRRFVPIALAAVFVLMGGKCGKPPKPIKVAAIEAIEQALDIVDLEAELDAHDAFGVVVALDEPRDERGWLVVRFARAPDGSPEARVEVDGEELVFALPLDETLVDAEEL